MRNLFLGCSLALFLWFVMFSPWTSQQINFWFVMSFSAVSLTSLSWLNQRERLRQLFVFKKQDVLWGLSSAIILYGIFYFGKVVLLKIFPVGQAEITSIYATRHQASPLLIGSILFFLIGPAEEIFWRGYVQDRLTTRWGQWPGFLAAVFIYTIVHIWSFNVTLLIAALVCGLFWGLLFLKTRRLWPVIISHALWDVLIFVIIPVY